MDYLVSLQMNGTDNQKIEVGEGHHIPWDVRELVYASSGLAIFNDQQIGSASAMVPVLQKGILELSQNSADYSQYDILYGLGTVSDTLEFYSSLLSDCMAHPYAALYGCIV